VAVSSFLAVDSGARGKGTRGQAPALRFGGRRCAPTALRCSVPRPRRRTHCAPYGRCVRTASTNQTTMRAARAATNPALLGTSEARLRLPGRAFAEPRVACGAMRTIGGLRGGRCPRGAISVATRRRAGTQAVQWTACALRATGPEGPVRPARPAPGSARVSALRELTCRGCLNAATAGRVVSSAARPRCEHRSEVGLKGRPPQHEPPAGSACRDAPNQHRSAGSQPKT